MCFFTRSSRDAPDPKSSPPALHNARYDGWPSPPLQLPNVSSPSFKKPAERRTAFAIDAPSNRRPRCPACGSLSQPLLEHHPIHPHCDTHPRANSGVQDIMCPEESRRRNISHSCPCMLCNSGTRQNQSLQGAFDTHTAVRHHAAIKHDPAQRTDDNKDTQISYLLAASPWMPLEYDLRHDPMFLQFHPMSKHAGLGYGLLEIPLTPAQPKKIRLISKDFPWEINLEPSYGSQYITCLNVLNVLHTVLQLPLRGAEWDTTGKDKHASLIEARDRRMAMGPAWRGSLNSKASTTAKSRRRLEYDAYLELGRQQPMILRVDWLGIRTAFGGLVKDEAFAKSRLIPGASKPPETWVVTFRTPPLE